MSLDLAPETESLIREYASREGMNADEYLHHLLRTHAPRPKPVPADDPVLRFLQERLQEAESATPEEVAEDDAAFEQFQQAMNANRRANGERLLFPDAEKPGSSF
jgi:hypothetical protein